MKGLGGDLYVILDPDKLDRRSSRLLWAYRP